MSEQVTREAYQIEIQKRSLEMIAEKNEKHSK